MDMSLDFQKYIYHLYQILLIFKTNKKVLDKEKLRKIRTSRNL